MDKAKDQKFKRYIINIVKQTPGIAFDELLRNHLLQIPLEQRIGFLIYFDSVIRELVKDNKIKEDSERRLYP